MLRPSKKLAFALEAVVDIAQHSGHAPVQSQDIADRLGLPRRYLEQVMQQLVRAGILRGVRGPRGGYRLAREPEAVSVGEVWRIVHGGDPAEFDGSESVGRSRIGREVLAPYFAAAGRELLAQLDRVTLTELLLPRARSPRELVEVEAA
jgi:Rrf2 family protein